MTAPISQDLRERIVCAVTQLERRCRSALANQHNPRPPLSIVVIQVMKQLGCVERALGKGAAREALPRIRCPFAEPDDKAK